MTDLDRKIAELKGWRYHKDNNLGEGFIHETPLGDLTLYGTKWWSTDIAKAFELVNEVCGPRADRLKPISFSLICAEPDGWVKRVKFFQWENNRITKKWDGEGGSIQEAICRAYIALREREGKK